ncbi:MAG: hypothetical protein ABJC63_08105 [Gemmatimonadales bacterium]
MASAKPPISQSKNGGDSDSRKCAERDPVNKTDIDRASMPPQRIIAGVQ